MVGCVVKQPVGVLPPVLVFLRKYVGKARHEHEHDVAVRVELREAQVQASICIDRGYHVHPVAQRLRGHRVALSPLPPLLVAKVKVRQPRLVNVDDTLTLL